MFPTSKNSCLLLSDCVLKPLCNHIQQESLFTYHCKLLVINQLIPHVKTLKDGSNITVGHIQHDIGGLLPHLKSLENVFPTTILISNACYGTCNKAFSNSTVKPTFQGVSLSSSIFENSSCRSLTVLKVSSRQSV